MAEINNKFFLCGFLFVSFAMVQLHGATKLTPADSLTVDTAVISDGSTHPTSTQHPDLHIAQITLPKPTSCWKRALCCITGTAMTSIVFIISGRTAYLLAKFLGNPQASSMFFVYIVGNGCLYLVDFLANQKQRDADYASLIHEREQDPSFGSSPENNLQAHALITFGISLGLWPTLTLPIITCYNIANIGDHCGKSLLAWIGEAQKNLMARLKLDTKKEK